jgi:N-acetyl-gamma-glutamyl-phosphate reductase
MDGRKTPIGEIFRELEGECELECEDYKGVESLREAEVVFTSLPNRVSMEIVPPIFEEGKKVVDLSGDFRLKDPSLYKKWYGVKHTCEDLLEEVVYGLPELYREKIRRACIVANPGCYPTSVILALAPLLKERLIDPQDIIIDAKSGISGAGRSPSLVNYFPERNENITPYKITSHQHIPEIEQELSILASDKVRVVFIPHLIPMNRGILSSIYIKTDKDEEKVRSTYLKFYKDEPFIRLLKEGEVVNTRDVEGSNYCEIALWEEKRTEGRWIIFSCIDNLGKGAAGQAVQNMNIMCGFDETLGLRLKR